MSRFYCWLRWFRIILSVSCPQWVSYSFFFFKCFKGRNIAWSEFNPWDLHSTGRTDFPKIALWPLLEYTINNSVKQCIYFKVFFSFFFPLREEADSLKICINFFFVVVQKILSNCLEPAQCCCEWIETSEHGISPLMELVPLRMEKGRHVDKQ